MHTNTNNSVFCFHARPSAGLALVFLSLFFLNAEVVLADDVPAPGWLSEEYMEAAAEESEHKEASVKPGTVGVSGYTKTFIISAYYSPLQGQQKYVTGSYAGDIRLNGSGVNGADGTPVYPGMIAAPRTYPFGTKMHIPGVGTVAVHDRGGAIVSSGQRGNAHDRLDVWMGYGDKGLQRALSWGKRTVDVTVYGVDPAIKESIQLDGYSENERQVVPDSLNPADVPSVGTTPSPASPVKPAVAQARLFSGQLTYGHSGPDVAKLQTMLKELDYYQGEVTSVFDQATYDAVAALQVAEKIIPTKKSYGAGFVGPQTMAVLASKEIAPKAQAKAVAVGQETTFEQDLALGDTGDEVRLLQKELKRMHLLGIEPTGYYGEVTHHAVMKFQQANKLVADGTSPGAGIFGPITRTKFNAVIAARLETERQRLARAEK